VATATCSGWNTSIRATTPRSCRASCGSPGRIDDVAFERGLITLSTQPTRDGFAGDQSLFAPAFTATDEELAEMVSRFAEVVGHVAEDVERELSILSTTGGAR
jgi:adenosylmethionine-8-amino-7-oxononanoate aminotransferase